MGGEYKGDFTDIAELQDLARGIDPDQKTGQDSKFETFFERPYEEIKKVVDDNIKDNFAIVDIGCGVGNLEDYIDQTKNGCNIRCADNDPEVVEKINQKEYKNIEVTSTLADANDYLASLEDLSADTVLVNATLHEINTPEDQAKYLDEFFKQMMRILKVGGNIIIGDYYYADEVSDEEVAQFIEYQKATINHADARNKFIKPGLLKQKAIDHGFEVIQSNEIPAVAGIDRRYYTVVFEKR